MTDVAVVAVVAASGAECADGQRERGGAAQSPRLAGAVVQACEGGLARLRGQVQGHLHTRQTHQGTHIDTLQLTTN